MAMGGMHAGGMNDQQQMMQNNMAPGQIFTDNNKQMFINFKGMDNMVVQGDDKSRMHNIL